MLKKIKNKFCNLNRPMKIVMWISAFAIVAPLLSIAFAYICSFGDWVGSGFASYGGLSGNLAGGEIEDAFQMGYVMFSFLIAALLVYFEIHTPKKTLRDSIANNLTELQALKDSGVINDDEFIKLKSKLIEKKLNL